MHHVIFSFRSLPKRQTQTRGLHWHVVSIAYLSTRFSSIAYCYHAGGAPIDHRLGAFPPEQPSMPSNDDVRSRALYVRPPPDSLTRTAHRALVRLLVRTSLPAVL